MLKHDSWRETERRGNYRRRRSDRWRERFRPLMYGLLIDTALFVAFFVAQRRTHAGLNVLSRRLDGESEAAFPRPRFLGNGNIGDFQRLAKELEELRRNATTDLVTGLPNPAMTQTSLLLYVEVAAREDATLSACVADLDNFKQINEAHGHLAGNEVLRQLGERLRGCLDAGQPIGRWGGDEFLLLFPRTDLESARAEADRVRRAVDGSPFDLLDGTRLQLTVTIGVASAHGEALDANRLFAAADADLRETKKGGRNRVGKGRLA